MNPVPTTMPAVLLEAHGGPEHLHLAQVPVPAPGPGQVLVRTAFAGVNPVDWKVREGGPFVERTGARVPFILGYDVAGTVVAIGEGVSQFAVGDRVGGMPHFPRLAGGYAAYAAADAHDLAALPAAVDLATAGAVPLAGLTALQALDALALPAGATLVVQAAAGGVGHLAVQLAKRRGLRVIGTCSTRNVGFVQSLGVDDVVDYTATPVESVIRDADAVLDPLGGERQTAALACVRDGGQLLTIVALAPATEAAAAPRGIRCSRVLVAPSGTQMAELYGLMASRALRVHVGATFALGEVRAAHELSRSGRAVGKIVLATR